MTLRHLFALFFALGLTPTLANAEQVPAEYSYDEGPLILSELPGHADYQEGFDAGEVGMQKELVDILAEMPYARDLTQKISRYHVKRGKWQAKEKFRYTWGPVPVRMPWKKNSIKIMFVGQDATHIAEAANRPATAGFGGRAQDMAAYFGVDYSAGFTNMSAYTIYGQYAVRNTPILVDKDAPEDGFSKERASFAQTSVVPNDTWMIFMDESSPYRQTRDKLLDWVFRNNKESLRMIVPLGQAGKDAVARFIESIGGKVGVNGVLVWEDGRPNSKKSLFVDDVNEETLSDYMSSLLVPHFGSKPGGGNSEVPVLLDKDGKEIKQKISKENATSIKEALPQVVMGPAQNGILHPAQINGFSLDKIFVKGKNTRSLKGLKLSDGSTIENDVVVFSAPHPTFLSGNARDTEMNAKKGKYSNKMIQKYGLEKLEAMRPGAVGVLAASDIVRSEAAKIKSFRDKNDWYIQADASIGESGFFDKKEEYTYRRATRIHPRYYEFGAPKSRMVTVSSAVRQGQRDIVVGSRIKTKLKFGSGDAAKTFYFYDKDQYQQISSKTSMDQSNIGEDELLVGRPRSMGQRYTFDPGPGLEYAELLKKLPSRLFKKKKQTKDEQKELDEKYEDFLESIESVATSGDKRKLDDIKKSLKRYKREWYYTSSDPKTVGDFGHYRGFFRQPEVLIVADPDGYDDLMTSRALTGTRGQYLQGFLSNLGFSDDYLVLKTVPFGMDDASESEWDYVYKHTNAYRKAILQKITEEHAPAFIFADGKYAQKAVTEIFGSADNVVLIPRDGLANSSGLKETLQKLKAEYEGFEEVSTQVSMQSIPRSHLPFYARVWEGTAGDRVMNTNAFERGKSFMFIAPKEIRESNPVNWHMTHTKKMLKKLEELGFPRPSENLPDYLKRVGTQEDQMKKAG